MSSRSQCSSAIESGHFRNAASVMSNSPPQGWQKTRLAERGTPSEPSSCRFSAKAFPQRGQPVEGMRTRSLSLSLPRTSASCSVATDGVDGGWARPRPPHSASPRRARLRPPPRGSELPAPHELPPQGAPPAAEINVADRL